jgi:hypothetical protein
VVAVFGVIYAVGGYGARNTSMYIDPVSEPLRYASALVVRLPIYLHASLAGPPSEAAILYGVIHPALPHVMWTLAVLVVAGFAWVAHPVLRDDREGTFWLAGAVLAAAPACAGYPQDRLLLFSSLGMAAVVARLIVAVARRGDVLYASRPRRWLAIALASWLFVLSVPLSVPGLAIRSSSTRHAQALFTCADESIPTAPSIAEKTLVLVNPPFEPIVFYAQYQRAARGAPRPARTRVLGTSGSRELHVERVDGRSLRIWCEEGILGARASDMMMRSSARDLRAGARVEVPGMGVEVERVTSDGRPASVLFRFDRDLDDPSLVFMRWDKRGFAAFTPPVAGATTTLPAVDLVELFTKT